MFTIKVSLYADQKFVQQNISRFFPLVDKARVNELFQVLPQNVLLIPRLQYRFVCLSVCLHVQIKVRYILITN